MAGSLVLLESETASNSASVTLGTTTWDNSYNVYMVTLESVTPATDADYLRMRFTKTTDNSVDDSSNYDRAAKELRADTTFNDSSQTNQNAFNFIENGTGTSETHNSIMYLFNFNNASEYSFATFEEASVMYNQDFRGRTGGGVLTVAQATNGVNYFYPSGNIASGRFVLYGLRK